MEETEVCIIGAGLAGLSAARWIRKPAILIEKKSEIGKPVRCGEGISLAAFVRENIPTQGPHIANLVNEVRRSFPNAKVIGQMRERPYAAILFKDKLEQWLSSQSAAEIRLNTILTNATKENDSWLLTTNQGVIRTKYVIAADGPASVVRRLTMRPKINCLPAVAEIISASPRSEEIECCLFFGNQVAPGGYTWVFKQSGNYYNVGITMRENGASRNYLQRFLNEKFTDIQRLENRSGLIPSQGWSHDCHYENILFVGDAGSFVDPIFKGGNGLALATGRLAAQALNHGRPQKFTQDVKSWPISAGELNSCANWLYGADDKELCLLADYMLNSDARQEKYADWSRVKYFLETWGKARNFVW